MWDYTAYDVVVLGFFVVWMERDVSCILREELELQAPRLVTFHEHQLSLSNSLPRLYCECTLGVFST